MSLHLINIRRKDKENSPHRTTFPHKNNFFCFLGKPCQFPQKPTNPKSFFGKKEIMPKSFFGKKEISAKSFSPSKDFMPKSFFGKKNYYLCKDEETLNPNRLGSKI